MLETDGPLIPAVHHFVKGVAREESIDRGRESMLGSLIHRVSGYRAHREMTFKPAKALISMKSSHCWRGFRFLLGNVTPKSTQLGAFSCGPLPLF